MKKILVGLFVIMASVANAQDKDSNLGHEIKKDAKSAGHAIKSGAKATGRAVGKGAKAVGKKTSEVASKGQSKIVDKTYEGKAGPHGETIYVNDESKYYWVDKKGRRHYVLESELKDKNS
jgi:hypothetical protein